MSEQMIFAYGQSKRTGQWSFHIAMIGNGTWWDHHARFDTEEDVLAAIKKYAGKRPYKIDNHYDVRQHITYTRYPNLRV